MDTVIKTTLLVPLLINNAALRMRVGVQIQMTLKTHFLFFPTPANVTIAPLYLVKMRIKLLVLSNQISGTS